MNEGELFSAAIQIADPAERAACLDRDCGGNAELRQRVEVLLKAYEQAGSFLQQAAAERRATAELPKGEPATSELPGTLIGPYKLLQQIGEGGMGVVWMAEQTEPVKRKVAIKVIKPGMDSRQVIARFEAERQALAMMDHVNIARVFDGGTTDRRPHAPREEPPHAEREVYVGRPYFVMELVHGVPITKYCDDNHLTPRERLELFVPVCQAIQHAHQKGIIHRDIKPSNVMVTLYDGKPVPKVIDFGVAKATEQKLTERTLFTQYGTMIGTLEYMSPEQAEMSALGVDTRSDIYSLGVLLYELLTGSTPLTHKRMKEAAYAEILRMIKEEEPPRPSTRLSDSGEALASISAQRHTEPAKLSKLMRGELDWIVMKTLEKDRNRRYETANGFAADVQRYLDGEAVHAVPPSAGYRMRKFARRNKGPVLAASLVVAVLILGVVGTTWGLWRAKAEAHDKEQARLAAEASFQDTRAAVDDFFTKVSESALFDVPGLQPLRRDLLEKAVRYYRGMAERRGDDPAVLVGLAVAHLRLATVLYEVDQNDEAVAAADAGLDVVERLRREHPGTTRHHRKLAGFWMATRRLAHGGKYPKNGEAAHRTFTRFIDLWGQFAREIPDEPAFQHDLAGVYDRFAELEWRRQGWDQAFVYLCKAVDILEGLHRRQPKNPQYRASLAMAYARGALSGKQFARSSPPEWLDRAIAFYEELAREFPDVPQHRLELAVELTHLGQRLTDAGQQEEAAQAFRRSLGLQNTLLAQSPGAASFFITQLDNVRGLKALGKQGGLPTEAEKGYRHVIGIYGQLVAANPDEPTFRLQVAHSLFELAKMLTESDQQAEAQTCILDAIKQWQEAAKLPKQADYRPKIAAAYTLLATVFRVATKYKDAEAVSLQAIALWKKLAEDEPEEPEHRLQLSVSFVGLGYALTSLNRRPEAETAQRQALEITVQLTKEFPANIRYRYSSAWQAKALGDLYRVMTRLDDAAIAYRQALAFFQCTADAYPDTPVYRANLATTYGLLATVLRTNGKLQEADEAEREAKRLSKEKPK